jgi:hypothetical protein
LIERMRDRAISIADLNHLRLWVDTKPEVPEDDLMITATPRSLRISRRSHRNPLDKFPGFFQSQPIPLYFLVSKSIHSHPLA